jgi:hypothetical protein
MTAEIVKPLPTADRPFIRAPQWWAHPVGALEFIRMNITATILKKIEDLLDVLHSH